MRRLAVLAVDLDGNNRLIFEPDHDPVRVADGDGIDLQQVTAVKILGMKDYH
jgi:proteic killer suppression protein